MFKLNRREFLEASTASLVATRRHNQEWLYAPAAVAGAVPDRSAFVRTSAQGKSWTVGNGLVEREIRFDPKFGLSTENWIHKVTGRNFLKKELATGPLDSAARNGPDFLFQVDGTPLAGAKSGFSPDFDFVSAQESDIVPSGRVLEVKLRGTTKPLEVSVFYAVYSGHPVIRKWLAMTNRGGQPVKLSHLAFEAVNLAAAPPAEQVIFASYGVHPREIFFTGRAEDAAIVAKDPRTREGFIVMNEAPGWMKRTEMTNWGDGIRVMYDTDLFPFERSLNPGETFTTAKSSVAFFVEDRGTADPYWVMPSYTSQVLMKKGAAYPTPWVYNTYEPFYFGLPKTTVDELAPVAGKLGLDIFTLDAGWEKFIGENEIMLKRYPEGLEPVRDEVERPGMRLGLWVPFAVVRPESQVYREHPEWQCRDAEGRPKTTWQGAEWGGNLPVMCLASPYREAAARRISDLIARYHLGYVKIDLTTVFNAYGEAPGCSAQGHYHQNWAESLAGIYEGMQYVTDLVYREHPDVLLDITYEAWGQKHIIDYGLLAAGDLDWMSNVDDTSATSAGPRQARTLLYQRAMAIPVETMLIGNLRATAPNREEHFATVIGSAPLFLGDLRTLSTEQVTWLGEKIRWFKELRRAVPMNEGFFPLGDWRQPSVASWDGFARLSRQGEGMVVLFKNESKLDNVEVKLPAYPDGDFQVRSAMTGQALGTRTGRQFRQGIQIALPADHQVEIMEIRKPKATS
jgi:alpha-galactosidase